MCDEEYHLTGSDIRTCGDDGNWSGTDTACERPAGKSSFYHRYIIHKTPSEVSTEKHGLKTWC